MNDVILFLTEQYNKGPGYSALNTAVHSETGVEEALTAALPPSFSYNQFTII